jgi:DnaJ like chaperone protein
MQKMRLNPELRAIAIYQFNKGKDNNFSLIRTLQKLKAHCDDESLTTLFVKEIIDMAMLNKMSDNTQRILLIICHELEYHIVHGKSSTSYFHHTNHQRSQQHHQQQQSSQQQSKRKPIKPTTPSPYAILEVPENATMPEVKKAYLRLISHHHPDKVIANGGDENAVRIATLKTQQIAMAYQQIKKSYQQKQNAS